MAKNPVQRSLRILPSMNSYGFTILPTLEKFVQDTMI